MGEIIFKATPEVKQPLGVFAHKFKMSKHADTSAVYKRLPTPIHDIWLVLQLKPLTIEPNRPAGEAWVVRFQQSKKILIGSVGWHLTINYQSDLKASKFWNLAQSFNHQFFVPSFSGIKQFVKLSFNSNFRFSRSYCLKYSSYSVRCKADQVTTQKSTDIRFMVIKTNSH